MPVGSSSTAHRNVASYLLAIDSHLANFPKGLQDSGKRSGNRTWEAGAPAMEARISGHVGHQSHRWGKVGLHFPLNVRYEIRWNLIHLAERQPNILCTNCFKLLLCLCSNLIFYPLHGGSRVYRTNFKVSDLGTLHVGMETSSFVICRSAIITFTPPLFGGFPVNTLSCLRVEMLEHGCPSVQGRPHRYPHPIVSAQRADKRDASREFGNRRAEPASCHLHEGLAKPLS